MTPIYWEDLDRIFLYLVIAVPLVFIGSVLFGRWFIKQVTK